MTLQTALSTASPGQTVSVDPEDYVFTKRLTVPKQVQLDAAGPTTLAALVTVTGGGLSATDNVSFVVTATGALITVNTAGAVLSGLTVIDPDPDPTLRPTGIQLGASATGVEITDFTMTGGGQAPSFGINLNAGSATITDADISGVATGVSAATTSSLTGISVVRGTFATTTTGITLGAARGPILDAPRLTGSGAASSIGINLNQASDAVLDGVVVDGYVTGVTTSLLATGGGPVITDPVITGFSQAGIGLGSTQGAVITGAEITGTGTINSTAISTMNAGRVTVTDARLANTVYGVGALSALLATSDRADFVLTDITVDGAAGSSGVYLLGATNARIENLDADVVNGGIILHQATGTSAEHVTVTGRDGSTATSGAAILRAYDSDGVTVDDSSIDDGSYGFYLSSVSNVTLTDARVSGVSEYGLYARGSDHVDLSGSTISDTGGIGGLVVESGGDTVSRDIAIHDNTMTDNARGLNVYQGTRRVTFTDNSVSGQRFAVHTSAAHNLLVADNDIDFTPAGGTIDGAVWVDSPYANPGTDDYRSSNIRVLGNTFTGAGPFVEVGTPDSTRDLLEDVVEVSGNVFPRDAIAVRTYPLADPATSTAVVDARDSGSRGANDFGSPCRARVTAGPAQDQTDPVVYDGGGSWIHQNLDGQVLYPEACAPVALIDLTIIEEMITPGPHHDDDVVSWTITPYDYGPRPGQPGWSITTLLPDTLELVSITGPGYTFDTSDPKAPVATSDGSLPPGTPGPPVTVTARIDASAGSFLKTVSYIAPTPDDVPEINPLVVPDLSTDTALSPTNNDDQGFLAVVLDAPPLPIDLTLDEELTDSGPYREGDTVTWRLIPHNNGPGTALAGWSVSQLFPDGLELESFTGTGYGVWPASAGGFTVTAGTPIPPGADGPVLTVTARVTTTTAGPVKNVAYVRPAGSDVPETNPLVVPTLDTDTGASTTNNDTQGVITVRVPGIDLALEEDLGSAGPYEKGDQVTWRLTPHNDGPDDAAAGWTITQLLPATVQVVSVRGADYEVDRSARATAPTAVATDPLPAGEDGPVLTVTVRVTGGQGPVRNVAYVAPADGDAPEANPLVVPSLATDTTTSATDNDTEGVFRVTVPTSNPEGGTDPGSGNPPSAEPLPSTGSEVPLALPLVGIALVLLGAALVVVGRRRVS